MPLPAPLTFVSRVRAVAVGVLISTFLSGSLAGSFAGSFGGSFAGSPGVAWAAVVEDNAAVGKIALLNRKAIEEYQNLDFDQAQKLLHDALDLAGKSGLNQHPIRARTYVTLGIVTLGGLKQRDAAIKLFRKALQIQPEIKLSRGLANPEIEAAFEEAISGLASEPREDLPPEKLLVHEPTQAAGQGQSIAIAATPDKDLAPGTLILGFRPQGAPAFVEVPMDRQAGGGFVGDIPATATAGDTVSYYIEARAADGKPLASRGSAASPFVVTLSRAAPLPPPMVVAPPVEPPVEPPRPADEKKFFVALAVGSGYGWIASGASGEETRAPINQGTGAWARLGQLAPQIGYFVTPNFMIGVQGRFQLVTGAKDYQLGSPPPAKVCGGDGVCSSATGALAGLLKASWFFGESKSALRPYASLSVGGGAIRHVTTFNALDHCGTGTNATEACVDTVAEGPFLFGAGFGVDYRLSETVAFVAALEGLAGVPNFAINADLNLGVAFQF